MRRLAHERLLHAVLIGLLLVASLPGRGVSAPCGPAAGRAAPSACCCAPGGPTPAREAVHHVGGGGACCATVGAAADGPSSRSSAERLGGALAAVAAGGDSGPSGCGCRHEPGLLPALPVGSEDRDEDPAGLLASAPMAADAPWVLPPEPARRAAPRAPPTGPWRGSGPPRHLVLGVFLI